VWDSLEPPQVKVDPAQHHLALQEDPECVHSQCLERNRTAPAVDQDQLGDDALLDLDLLDPSTHLLPVIEECPRDESGQSNHLQTDQALPTVPILLPEGQKAVPPV